MKKIRLATRGSKLALTQTQWVVDRLQEAHPDLKIEIEVIKTRGDRGDLSVMGAFIKELEVALIAKKVDLAVHSLKDLPTQLPKELTIAAIPERENAQDVFISKNKKLLSEMTEGNTIGTGSPRRKFQITCLNPKVKIVPIKGNIDTRIGFVKEGKVDGIVLAAAGINRMSFRQQIAQSFSIKELIPAPGQGALALQTRKEDQQTIELVQCIHHSETAIAVNAERKILEDIGGGCQLPVGCHVELSGQHYQIHAFYGLKKDGTYNTSTAQASPYELEKVVSDLVNELIAKNVVND